MLLGVTYYGDMLYIGGSFAIAIALVYLVVRWALKKWRHKK